MRQKGNKESKGEQLRERQSETGRNGPKKNEIVAEFRKCTSIFSVASRCKKRSSSGSFEAACLFHGFFLDL